MELNEFLTKFKSQYFDSEDIKLETLNDFRAIDSYDSLTGMALLVMLKDEFGVSLTDEQWRNLHTVEEVYNYITK